MEAKIKLSKREVSQTIDLKEVFKGKIDDNILKKEIKDISNEFFSSAYDKIIERTASGRDIDGRKFEKYSKEYAKEKGVSRNAVDMELKGDMLNAIVEDLKGLRLRIKIEGDKEIKKSYNHNYGDTLPERKWFGLSEKEINKIAKEVAKEFQKPSKATQTKQSTQSSEQVKSKIVNNAFVYEEDTNA